MLRLSIILVFLLLATGVSAEISDKIVPMQQFIIQGIFFGTAAYIIARINKWLSLLAVAFFLLLLWGGYEVITEPGFGAAIIKEQGLRYPIIMFSSNFMILLGVGVGIWHNQFRRKDA